MWNSAIIRRLWKLETPVDLDSPRVSTGNAAGSTGDRLSASVGLRLDGIGWVSESIARRPRCRTRKPRVPLDSQSQSPAFEVNCDTFAAVARVTPLRPPSPLAPTLKWQLPAPGTRGSHAILGRSKGTILRTFDYDFDPVGRLVGLDDSAPLAADFDFVYDARGQLQLESQQHGFLGQAIVFDRDYDAVGNRTLLEANDRSQLTSATTVAIPGMTPPFGLPSAEGYDFDAGGNREGSGGTPQSATGTHNQLQTDGTFDYFYDGEGNVIRRESISGWAATLYEWDHRNRLVAVKESPFYQAHPSYQNVFTLYVEYVYDAFDQRIGKRVEDAQGPYGWSGPAWKRYEAYVWADGQEVLRFTDSDGLGSTEPFRLASRYLWGDRVDQFLAEEQFAGDSGPAIDATTADSTAGETFWPLTDHLGSVRGLVDNNGVIRQHITYDSFGNRLVEQHYDTAGAPVAATHAEAIDSLFGYTGRDWDADTDLQYNRARWYDPSTGRWLSKDPIGFEAGDANLYRYVGNGATTKADPSGLEPPSVPPNWVGPNLDLLNETTHYGPTPWGVVNTTDQRVLEELYRNDMMMADPMAFAEASVRAMDPGGANVVAFPNGYQRWMQERQATAVNSFIPFLGSCAEIRTGLKYDDPTRAAVGAVTLGLEVVPVPVGRILGRFRPRGVRPMQLPVEDLSLVGTGTLGYTRPDGSIFLQPGLTRADQRHVLRHESVHAFFSPRGSGRLTRFRQTMGQCGYDNSQLLRFTEEAIAETYGSGSIMQGLSHPIRNPYGLSGSGLIIETSIYGTSVTGGVYGGQQIGQSIFE